MFTNLLTLPSVLFLAAHALRTGSPGGAIFWLAAGGLAFSRASWKNWGLAALLGFGAWLWGDIALSLVRQRMELDLPWHRLAAILGGVALLCSAAALLHGRRALRQLSPENLVQALAFLLPVGGLALARQKASLDILLVDRFFPSGGWVVVFFLGCYGAWIAGKMLRPENSGKWRRTIWTIFSAVFFSQLLLGLAGLEQFLMTGKLHLPVPALIAAGPLYRGEEFFMLILFAVTLLLVGPAWCSHLCYIGAWDNWAASGKRSSTALPGWTKSGRWIICLVVLATAVLLGKSGLPVTLAVYLAAAFGLFGIAVMLLWSRKTGTMSHCISYCPMGLLANIFGKVNPWRIRISPECCKCGRCSKVCRYAALSGRDIERGRAGFTCSLCGDCLASCPQGSLHYHFPGLGSSTARALFITVIVTLHVLFLGVARL